MNSQHLLGKGDGGPRLAAAGVADARDFLDERKRPSDTSGLKPASLAIVGVHTKCESMTLMGASDAGGKVAHGRPRACPPGAAAPKLLYSAAAVKLPADALKAPAKPAQSLPLGQAGCVDGGDAYADCLLYTSPSPRDRQKSRMPSSA